jgi:GntR family transcriptional regulator, transcriptional repressor for pyruvate dehydrogenase complex
MLPATTAFSPLPQQKSASERVGDRLRDLIASGNLAAGEKLPSENELARALQVSRPVVREALRGLSMMGIVESRQGGGCFVTDLSASRLMSPLSFYLQLRDYSMEELFRARSLIDGGLAADAARNGDASQKERLAEMARMGHELAVDPVGFRVMDAQFHDLISAMAGNGFLHSVAQSLYSLAMELRRQASRMPGVTAQSARDHQAIAEAILAGDATAAREAMLAHVEHIRVTTQLAAELAAPDP